MPPEPNPNLTGIEALTGLVKDIQVKIEEGDQKVAVALKDIQNEQKSIKDWVAEVEKTAAKARTTALPNGETDAVKSAIPDRHRKALDLHMRTGVKHDEAVRLTAMESWVKNSILLANPQVAARAGGKLLEEMEKIERSFGFEPQTRAALQEDTASEGGYTVPVPLEAEVLRQIEDASIMRSLCRVMPMMAKTHNIPDLATNLSVAIVAEEGTINPSEPTFGQKALTAKKIATRAIASLEVVQDSAIGLISFLTTLMSEKYGLFEDDQVLEGDGTGSNFTGVVAAASVNEVTNGANGAAPSYAKIIEQKWKAKKRSTRRGAGWVGAPGVAQKLEALVDTQGQPIFKDDSVLATRFVGREGQTPEGILKGYPFYSSDQIAENRTVGTSTDCSNLYFGPWGTSVIIGDLLGLTFGVSEHTQWATGQLDLRMLKRTAILVAVPANLTKQTGLRTA